MKKIGGTYQLPLFEADISPDPSLQEAISRVSWSYSQRSTLEQCARRYYYEHFGSNKRIANEEPAKERLHFLKNVSTRDLRTGGILHLGISTYFRKAQEGIIGDVDRLVNWACKIFRADQEYSQLYPDGGGDFSGNYPPVLLREYHYRLPNAADLCTEAEARMVEALLSFVTEGGYQQFRTAGSTKGALVERPFRLDNFPCRVGGKVDLAYQKEEKVTVVDWKIGAGDGNGDDSLQLATYALWAVSFFGCDPKSLRVCKAHLASREIVDFRVDDQVLAAAKARILQDAEGMAMLEEYGLKAIADAFTPCLQPKVCKMCSFEKVCYA